MIRSILKEHYDNQSKEETNNVMKTIQLVE